MSSVRYVDQVIRETCRRRGYCLLSERRALIEGRIHRRIRLADYFTERRHPLRILSRALDDLAQAIHKERGIDRLNAWFSRIFERTTP